MIPMTLKGKSLTLSIFPRAVEKQRPTLLRSFSAAFGIVCGEKPLASQLGHDFRSGSSRHSNYNDLPTSSGALNSLVVPKATSGYQVATWMGLRWAYTLGREG